MISEIIKVNGQYEFCVGKSKYKCPDLESLTEVRNEILEQKKQLQR